jgi:hypothetical protein
MEVHVPEFLTNAKDFATLEEIHDAVRNQIGVILFTVLAFTDEGRSMHRIYSSHPVEYPVGGKKDVKSEVAADWVAVCVDEQVPYFGRTHRDVERIFTDSDLIESLGCGSIINAPIIRDGVTIGALNILEAEGTYTDAQVDTALQIAHRSAHITEKTIEEIN